MIEIRKIHLTPRERKVVAELVRHPQRNKCIADKMGLTELSLRQSLHHLYRKIGVTDRFELYALALSRILPDGTFPEEIAVTRTE